MPAKNSLKNYVADGFYHIYNRGVEKRTIFQDTPDYKVFLSYLKCYLEPPQPPAIQNIKINGLIFKKLERPLNNYFDKLDLIGYCLMPNHFHLIIKQHQQNSMELFMRSLLTRYTMYFNRRQTRVGHLFQGTYKAVFIDNEAYLLHLSRYVHLNPVKETPLRGKPRLNLLENSFSSYQDYVGKRKTNWVKPEPVVSYFESSKPNSVNTYRSFVENYEQEEVNLIPNLLIDADL